MNILRLGHLVFHIDLSYSEVQKNENKQITVNINHNTHIYL